MVSDRSILDALSGETGLSSYTTGSNIDDIFKVFLFAADNSDVEWAVHRGWDNMYTIGTSHNEDSVDPYSVLSGKQIPPISSVHSHPGTTDLTTMGYISETYYRSDQWKVNNGLAPKYNYVYFPCLKSLYQAGWYTPVYIRRVAKFQDFYFGTLKASAADIPMIMTPRRCSHPSTRTTVQVTSTRHSSSTPQDTALPAPRSTTRLSTPTTIISKH